MEAAPDSVATHWSTGNEPDGYSSKAFAVFGLPVIMLILHLVCVIATNIDPKANSINKKIFFIVLWICPVFSIIVCSTVYGYNLGYQFDIGFLCGLLIGVLYLILGNFLPTVKPNYTIGFRISWALNDADNWYHTHRFGGKCMVIGGLLLIVTTPFQNIWVLMALAILPCILPVTTPTCTTARGSHGNTFYCVRHQWFKYILGELLVYHKILVNL